MLRKHEILKLSGNGNGFTVILARQVEDEGNGCTSPNLGGGVVVGTATETSL